MFVVGYGCRGGGGVGRRGCGVFVVGYGCQGGGR